MGRAMGALEIIVRKMDCGEEVPAEAIQKLLGFYRVFGDRYHHVKEEHVLIPRLEDSCESRFQCRFGPEIGVVYYEHEVARRLLHRMTVTSESLCESHARKAFVAEANEYLALMREHIAREKDSLIRGASWELSGEDRALMNSFRRYTLREGIAETSEQFASDIDEVLSELSVVVPPAHRRAYSRGSIPLNRGVHSCQITY